MIGTILSTQIPTLPDMLINRYGTLFNNVNSIVVNILQSNQTNQMRQRLFAECAQNSYNNPWFSKLSSICCFVALGCVVYKEQYSLTSNITQEVNESVAAVIEGVAADMLLNLAEYSHLLRDGNIYQDAQAIIAHVIELINNSNSRIRNYLTYLNSGTINNNNTLYGQNVVSNSRYSQPMTNIGLRTQNTTSRYVQDFNSPSQVDDKYKGRFSNKSSTQEFTITPKTEVKGTVLESIPKQELKKKEDSSSYKEEDWKPTLTNPYLTLITNESVRTFVNSNGNLIENIKKGNNPMDRKAHTLVGDVPVDSNNRVKKIEDLSVKHVDSLRLSNKEERTLKLKSYVHDKVELTDSLEYMLSYLRMLNLNDNDENKSSYFRYDILVCDTYPDKKDLNYMLDNLSKCTTYVSMSSQLNTYLDEIKYDKNSSDNEKVRALNYLSSINDRLTTFVNNFLTTGLGIGETMDSFVTDIASLETFLQNNYGVTHSGAYREFEYNTVQKILKMPFELDYINEHIKDEELTNIVLNYIPILYSVTFVNVFLSELGLKDVRFNKPYALSRLETPLLYNIASSIYKDKDPLISDPFNMEHLFITADNQRIKISSSYIARDLYVVTLLNK